MISERKREHYDLIVYTARDGFRWRQIDKRNREIVGAAHEAFSTKAIAIRNMFICSGWDDLDWFDGTRIRKEKS